MPRISPLYRFITRHYLEAKRMQPGLSEDAARQHALSLWDAMTSEEKKRFRESCLLELEIEAVSSEASSDSDAKNDGSPPAATIEDEDSDESSTPEFLKEVCEFPNALSSPEVLTIMNFASGRSIDTFFNGVFDGGGGESVPGRNLRRTRQGRAISKHPISL